MEGFGITLGLLLIVAGIWQVDFLLALFSYHNPFLELFGEKNFCKGCIIVGAVFLLWSVIEIFCT